MYAVGHMWIKGEQMARATDTKSKTQTLSLRLDPKTRFALEFVSKLRRQSITTVVEDAIQARARETTVDGFPLTDVTQRIWLDYWDVRQGVREIRMLADSDIPSDFEDDERRTFIEAHIEFFSETNELKNPDLMNVEVLWHRLEHYIQIWRDNRQNDPWAAGYEMKKDLENAGLKTPKWPRETNSPPSPLRKKPMPARVDPDDESPF